MENIIPLSLSWRVIKEASCSCWRSCIYMARKPLLPSEKNALLWHPQRGGVVQSALLNMNVLFIHMVCKCCSIPHENEWQSAWSDLHKSQICPCGHHHRKPPHKWKIGPWRSCSDKLAELSMNFSQPKRCTWCRPPGVSHDNFSSEDDKLQDPCPAMYDEHNSYTNQK